MHTSIGTRRLYFAEDSQRVLARIIRAQSTANQGFKSVQALAPDCRDSRVKAKQSKAQGVWNPKSLTRSRLLPRGSTR